MNCNDIDVKYFKNISKPEHEDKLFIYEDSKNIIYFQYDFILNYNSSKIAFNKEISGDIVRNYNGIFDNIPNIIEKYREITNYFHHNKIRLNAIAKILFKPQKQSIDFTLDEFNDLKYFIDHFNIELFRKHYNTRKHPDKLFFKEFWTEQSKYIIYQNFETFFGFRYEVSSKIEKRKNFWYALIQALGGGFDSFIPKYQKILIERV